MMSHALINDNSCSLSKKYYPLMFQHQSSDIKVCVSPCVHRKLLALQQHQQPRPFTSVSLSSWCGTKVFTTQIVNDQVVKCTCLSCILRLFFPVLPWYLQRVRWRLCHSGPHTKTNGRVGEASRSHGWGSGVTTSMPRRRTRFIL